MQKNKELDIDMITAAILNKMTGDLEKITPANKLQKALFSFQIVIQAAAALKAAADDYCFKDEATEISFYKITYAELLEEVYYYTLKYEFEAHSPYKDVPQKLAYLHHRLTRYKSELEQEHYFYNYIYLDETHLDAQYFTRSSDMPTPPDAAMGIAAYSSPADYYSNKFARILALIRVINELQSELTALNDEGVTAPKVSENGLLWTGPKVALIELVYALFEHGSINKGNVTLKRIIHAFEELFNISLDNYLTLYKQSIRMRKETRTPFLEALISCLSLRMDRFDEKPVRL